MEPVEKTKEVISDAKEKIKSAWKAVRGDGCTMSPDIHENIRNCCNQHDADYTTGTDENGNEITRAQADKRLFECMRKNSYTPIGKFIVAPFYYVAVRLFASNHWKTK